MSDEQSKELPDTDDTQEHPSASAGRLLKAGREKQGLSQQQVADKLFLKVTQIDDLENDRIDETTSVTFTRGYIRNYAKQLGLSQDDVIAEFDRLHTAAKQPAKLQSFSRRVAKQTHDDRWMMVTYAIVLMLLAGVVAWWYQQSGSETLVDDTPVTSQQAGSESDTALTTQGEDISPGGSEPERAATATNDEFENQFQEDNGELTQSSTNTAEVAQDASTTTEAVQDTVDEQAPPAVTTVQTQQPQNETSDGDSDQLVSDEVSDSTSVAPSETAPSEAVQSATADEPQPQRAERQEGAPINMVFRFADDCWVNIEDSTGEAIAYGIKQAGRVMEISGVPPVEVTLGAPDNVAITVDGEAVDMSVFPGGRTARFSLPIQE